MSFKKSIQKDFRLKVFERDSYKCRCCGKQGYDHSDPQEVAKQQASGAFLVELDAHHITTMEEMPAGGYVPENGISLCPECHLKAESSHTSPIEFQPDSLYRSIGSNRNNAYMASLELQKRLEKFENEESN